MYELDNTQLSASDLYLAVVQRFEQQRAVHNNVLTRQHEEPGSTENGWIND